MFIMFFIVLVKKQILQYQSGSIGLFPKHTANINNEESHVRDNIYCAMGVWALALAYRFVTEMNVNLAVVTLNLASLHNGSHKM